MEFLKRLAYGLSTGILLGLAWPMGPLFPLVFVGFIPLLLLERKITKETEKSGRHVFLHTYLSLLVWNLMTTWWVWNSSPGGAVAAFILNALLQSLPFLLFHHTRKRMGDKLGYLSLVVFWVAFEYLHLSWEFTWPWLTLGNVFASVPGAVQWYEYTGVLGGSIWVWVANITILFTIYSRFNVKQTITAVIIVAIPFVVSLMVPVNKPENLKEFEVLVVQPNVDCFTEKFLYNAHTGGKNTTTYIHTDKQQARLEQLTIDNCSPNTDVVLWPETSLPGARFWVDKLEISSYAKKVNELAKAQNVSMLIGVTSFGRYGPNDKNIPSGARESATGNKFAVFNSAIFVEADQKFDLYHKSKLVPGVERMPYPEVLPLEKLAISLGGVSGTLAIQEEREAFICEKNNVGAAPVICYESVFGDFVTDYFKEGADFIAIITNDGWWGNTSGHKQHFEYARLRAIENRSWVARSANTGISGFIAPDGSVVSTLEWDKMGALKHNITKRWKTTFYTEYGDYIGRILSFVSAFLLLSLFTKGVLKK